MSLPTNKLILVIGATGAQGMAVIDKLLAPSQDGTPSPYTVRALTRDPSSRRAVELAAKGVELTQGRFDDFVSVAAALQGVYGAFVNTDGFTVGEEKETWAGIRIFELAKQAGVRHYIYSSLDYVSKLTNYNPTYRCVHSDGKGRVHEFMKSQPSDVKGIGMTWSVITSTPYMDMLHNIMFGPVKKRDDGTVVFATPLSRGHVPMIALSDFGFFARYTFDNRELTSGAELKIGSDLVDWEYLRSTFEKVTGQKAEIIYQGIDEWFENIDGVNAPLAVEQKGISSNGLTTWRENFTAWWSMWRDDVVKRDWKWIRQINPTGHTLESWMRAEHYGEKGLRDRSRLLKIHEEGKSVQLNIERIALL